MNTTFSIPEVLNIADLSTPLSINYNEEGALFGPRLNNTNALTILMVADALRWQYESGLTIGNNSAIGVANYLIWLCGKFGLEAQNAISHTPINNATQVPPFTADCRSYTLRNFGPFGSHSVFSYVPCSSTTSITISVSDVNITISALFNSVILISGNGLIELN